MQLIPSQINSGAKASPGPTSPFSNEHSPGRQTKIAIVDDEESVRQALLEIIELEGENVCVGIYASAVAALAGIPKAKPDVILMDIRMPGMSGIECARNLKSACPTSKIIMLTALPDVSLLRESLQAGADGYLTKPYHVDELLNSIRLACSGATPMSYGISHRLIDSPDMASVSSPAWALLTEREREVINCLARGLFYKEVADRLSISERTVTQHVHHIYEKLGVHTKFDALNKLYPRGR